MKTVYVSPKFVTLYEIISYKQRYKSNLERPFVEFEKHNRFTEPRHSVQKKLSSSVRRSSRRCSLFSNVSKQVKACETTTSWKKSTFGES